MGFLTSRNFMFFYLRFNVLCEVVGLYFELTIE